MGVIQKYEAELELRTCLLLKTNDLSDLNGTIVSLGDLENGYRNGTSSKKKSKKAL